jgi:hypothetical protein
VSLTLPDDILQELNRVHPDTGWAIVKLLERERKDRSGPPAERDVELASIGQRRSLIVVSRAVFKVLPGVNLIPLTETRAFLALDPDRGMSDLELAVIDRLAEGGLSDRERTALESLRAQLAAWRHDQGMRFHHRSIVVVEQVDGPRGASRKSRRRSV